MLGLDAALVTAISTAIVLVVGALGKGIMEIIKFLRENKAEKVSARNSADEAKEAVTQATSDIRSDITVIAQGMAHLNGRFDSVEQRLEVHGGRIDELGKSQSALLDLIAEVDKKVSAQPIQVAPLEVKVS